MSTILLSHYVSGGAKMRERIQGTRREQLYIYFVVKRNDYCNYIRDKFRK